MCIRLFLEDNERGARDLLPDKEWPMIWTTESGAQATQKMSRLTASSYGGLRRKKGPWGGNAWVYGYRIPRAWYESGDAQHNLCTVEARPRY